MNWNAFKRLFHYLGRYKLRLILVMIAAVLSTLFTVLTPAVTGGITSELYDGVASGSFDWETIVWLLVPWAQDILDAIESGRVNLDHYLLDQWRLMHIGAQPVPPSLIKRWLKYFPHHKYDTNYGLSESIGPGCVHLGVDNIEKIGAIGKAGYLWQTRIIDEQGQDVAPGAIGELAVKGPGVMKCYYKNPEATAEILHGDWLWTGDMAREDEDGFIYLVDRKKDVIISGGENLYPVQIEDFLRRCGKIKDVAVIGLPDQRLGEIAAALQKKREIAVDVAVKAPTERTIPVRAELTAEQGWTMQEITDAATAALQAYFTGERLGEAVYTAKLASILYGVEGVKNCHLLAPEADVSVSATELPVLGAVTLTEIEAGEET